ncbi:MAG: GNAT family N-acetyltransferase [Halioglobus sp.]|nr:GNAT family N-acetyltransferase [Halioglobus sp.]
MLASSHELVRTVKLLNTVFTVQPPYSVEGLDWYYNGNPVGPAAVGAVDDGTCRSGNYALIPQRFQDGPGRAVVLGLGVDLAVLPEARGAGTFRRTVENAYRRGEEAGLDAIIGVANSNSAPRMAATLGWRTLEPLPVTLVAPALRGIKLEHRRVTSDLLGSTLWDELADGGFVAPLCSSGRFDPVWTSSYLRWRLARPGAQYSLHFNNDLVAVTTVTRMKGIRFVLILKVLVRRPIGEPFALAGIARSVMVQLGSPLVVHWGRNPALRVRGIRLPQEKMPSPLALVLHGLKPSFDEKGFELGSFEFLDFDAY